MKVGESSSTFSSIDPVHGKSTKVDLPPILPQLPPTPTASSSALSIPTSNMVAPLTKMERILVSRYAPLIFPNPLSAMPIGDYLKYMTNLTGEGYFTAKEHLEAFYSYAENIKIKQEDVWTRVLCKV